MATHGEEEQLRLQLEAQKTQLSNYENKLKEKKALELALEAISPAAITEIAGSSDTAKQTSKDGDAVESEAGKGEDQLAALKQALATLTVENKKKELAFQSDRRALIQKNEKLAEKMEALQSASVQQLVRRLKEDLRQVEAEKEKLLMEHGTVLAEVQQRYTTERAHSEKMEKQVTELRQILLSRRLQEKDDALGRYEARLGEVQRLEADLQLWRKKAEETTKVRVLREELATTKRDCEKELCEIRSRYELEQALLREKDGRIENLERQLREMGNHEGEMEALKANLLAELELAQHDLQLAKQQGERLKSPGQPNSPGGRERSELDPLVEFRHLYLKLKKINSDFDVYDSLCLERPSAEVIEPETGVLTPNLSNSSLCTQCESVQEELTHFKATVERLTKKLSSLEETLRSTNQAYSQSSEMLRQRIMELELAQSHSRSIADYDRRIAELEEELAQQRSRVIEVIAEKEAELEAARQDLTAIYQRTGGGTQPEPLDPKPKHQWQQQESGAGECPTNPPDLAPIRRSLSQVGESRNVFYEQELIRRDEEILRLRAGSRAAELKLRELEQGMLTKDIQYLQIVETLKEEIRILEGRLKLERSDNTNMAYLRNIFIQFLCSNSCTSRRHILRAIGAVLKLTALEMRKVETWNL